MPPRPLLLACCLPLLTMGCFMPDRPHVDAPIVNIRAGDSVRTSPPPDELPGCWHREMRPALYETVTEQRLLAWLGGTAESSTRQVEVRPRQPIWFEIPCPELANDEIFTASLQRALKARGIYTAEINGQRTIATSVAVREWQRRNGLDSAVLSLQTVRQLGLVALY